MNPDLEVLLKAYDALRESTSGTKADEAAEQFEIQVGRALQMRPGLSKESLLRMVEFAYYGWVRAQKKPSAMPPKA